MNKKIPVHKFAVAEIQKRRHDRVVLKGPITETDYQEGYRKGYEAGSRDAESRIRYASHDMGR